MSENLAEANAAAPSNEILQRLLERLYNALVSGPGLDCRPHTSRRHVNLTAFARFADLNPAAILPALLDTGKRAGIMAKTPVYRGPMGDDVELTDEQRAAKRASDDQNRLLAKLRDIAEDACDYEQDHGESALYIGYPEVALSALQRVVLTARSDNGWPKARPCKTWTPTASMRCSYATPNRASASVNWCVT